MITRDELALALCLGVCGSPAACAREFDALAVCDPNAAQDAMPLIDFQF